MGDKPPGVSKHRERTLIAEAGELALIDAVLFTFFRSLKGVPWKYLEAARKRESTAKVANGVAVSS